MRRRLAAATAAAPCCTIPQSPRLGPFPVDVVGCSKAASIAALKDSLMTWCLVIWQGMGPGRKPSHNCLCHGCRARTMATLAGTGPRAGARVHCSLVNPCVTDWQPHAPASSAAAPCSLSTSDKSTSALNNMTRHQSALFAEHERDWHPPPLSRSGGQAMGGAVPNIDLPISHGAAAPGYSALPVSPDTSPRLLQVCPCTSYSRRKFHHGWCAESVC